MFGNTLMIVNPAARSGQAAEAAAHTTSTLKEMQRKGSIARLDVRYTTAPGDGAAIALDTTELRRHTGRTGTSLYVQCALDQLTNHRVPRRCTLILDGMERDVEFYLLAVQNGPSYGGGFKICPNAHLDDGLLSVAYAKPTLSAVAALTLFAKARTGKHTKHPNLVFETARSMRIRLEETLPAQIDGEPICGLEHTIDIHRGELDVYFAL